jgi:hypothetical protein
MFIIISLQKIGQSGFLKISFKDRNSGIVLFVFSSSRRLLFPKLLNRLVLVVPYLPFCPSKGTAEFHSSNYSVPVKSSCSHLYSSWKHVFCSRTRALEQPGCLAFTPVAHGNMFSVPGHGLWNSLVASRSPL